MRRILCLLAAAALVASLAACSSNDFYRGRVEAAGGASAQVVRVKNGVESPVTGRYSVAGKGTATVQTIKPYLTLDGEWAPDVTPGASVQVIEEDGAVVIRSNSPVVGAAAPECPDGGCRTPVCPPAAAPGAAQEEDCAPVYVGCSGVPGGNRPMPSGDLNPQIPAGTGWPCASQGPVGDKVMGAVMIPAGVAAHVGVCVVKFARCLFMLP